jgi:hypothetical protein
LGLGLGLDGKMTNEGCERWAVEEDGEARRKGGLRSELWRRQRLRMDPEIRG